MTVMPSKSWSCRIYQPLAASRKKKNMPFEKIRELFKIENEAYGVSEEQIKLSEKELGFSLPNGLMIYYRTFGNHKGRIQLFEDFYPIEKLEFDKDEYLVFSRDSQTGIKWGIRREDMKFEHPNVYHKEGKWILDNDNILQTIIALGFEAASTKLPFSEFRLRGIEESEEQKVYKNFNKLKEELLLWNTKFYQKTPNDLIRLTKTEGEVHLSIGSWLLF